MVQIVKIYLKPVYVAKGHSQVAGQDYFETFAPTAKMTSLRMFLQIAAHENLKVNQMDVKAAYSNAPIDCDIYLEPPEGYRKDNYIWKLNMLLYGLKQSGRNWNIVIHDFLKIQDFRRSDADPCVYLHQENSVDSDLG